MSVPLEEVERRVKELSLSASPATRDTNVAEARDLARQLTALATPETLADRRRRSVLYPAVVRALVQAEAWSDAREVALYFLWKRDPTHDDRARLREQLDACNKRLGLPALPDECDLVMKGGITSGIVYPLAVTALARRFRFRSIGGASAGAIAAAATAAAQLHQNRTVPRPEARWQGPPSAPSAPGASAGFAALELLPSELAQTQGGASLLTRLFQPTRRTAPLLSLLLSTLRRLRPEEDARGTAAPGATPAAAPKPSFAQGLAAIAGGAGIVVTEHPGPLLLALLIGALSLWTLGSSGALGVGLLILLLLVLLLAAVLASAVWFLASAIAALNENGFGICSGMPAEASDGTVALTPWMTALFDRTAGMPEADSPLTFGHLRNAEVELVMMTTNLSFGRPYRLPFLEDDAKDFYFSKDEFRGLFPARVCHAMESAGEKKRTARSHVKDSAEKDAIAAAEGLLPFPDGDDLPVVVATRMSLSFPVLLSAIPLHAWDFTSEPPKLRRCWFSDGGICSNLPIHFFDALVPARPTFAINLVAATRGLDRTNEDNNVFMPRHNREGAAEQWSEVNGLFAFAEALIGTMQGWVDQTQLTTPGYRDRIVHITHSDEEGGLNLDMPAPVIAAMSARGEAAGRRVRDDFDWNNHLWVRVRSALDVAQRALDALRVFEPGTQNAALLATLADEHTRDEGDGVTQSYPISMKQREALALIGDALTQLAQALPQGTMSAGRTPSPEPELRVRPRI